MKENDVRICLRKDHYMSSQGLLCLRKDQPHHLYQHQYDLYQHWHHLYLEHHMYLYMDRSSHYDSATTVLPLYSKHTSFFVFMFQIHMMFQIQMMLVLMQMMLMLMQMMTLVLAKT